MAATLERPLSLSEAAGALAVSEKTVRRMVKSGELAAKKVNDGQWRIHPSVIRKYMTTG